MLHPSQARVTRALKRLARPVRAAGGFDASRYFRGGADLGFYDVGTRQVRVLAKEIYEANRERWTIDSAAAFAEVLIADRYLEVKAVGVEIIARYRRSFTPPLLSVWKRWLARNHSANWATTDAICGSLIGPLLVRYPALAGRLRGWSRNRNMWVRRASAVALIPSVRKGAALDIAYDVARTLHGDTDDLIQKAVGWLLREAGKSDAVRLERYLLKSGPGMPRTTVRYAIERFPDARRRALLQATRAPGMPRAPMTPIGRRSHGR
jgi:3-methyladenine DNA glycosylase AlkD